MSNRLESLNSKKPTTSSKPSLRFKPKVVARKSKEERAKEAPAQIKQETPPPKQSTRGRGSLRGRGRGGRANYSGTHLVSAGPLASGSVSLGNPNGSKLGLTQVGTFNSLSPTPEFLKNLKLKDSTEKSKSPAISGEEDSDDDGQTKISMNKEYRFADEETLLFPVRPKRDEIKEGSNSVPSQSKDQSQEFEEDTNSARESSVKSEPIEEKLTKIKEHKAELENKIAEPVNLLDQEESSKLIADHQEILDLVTERLDNLSMPDNENTGNKYILFQLPKILPKYENKNPVRNDLVKVENESNEILTQSTLVSNTSQLRGQIGHLNIHQSGKITINLGNSNSLTVAQGAPTSLLQEVVVLDMNESTEGNEDVEMLDEDGLKIKGKFYRLGEADGKIIGTPLII